MPKAVEISFAIGAALTGGFGQAFSKAGQVMSQLAKQSSTLQKTSGQIGVYQKMQGAMAKTSEKLNAARLRVKELGNQMRSTDAPSASLRKQFTAANIEANRLQVTLGEQRKKLGELRTELSGAGVDTKNLAASQQRLTAQSQKVTEAQEKLAQSRAAFNATREQLSFSNIKGELITAAGAGMSLMAPTMKSADFEQQMARIDAVAFSGAGRDKVQDAQDFEALRKQALQLGADTQFSAVQAAQSQENLARAGFKTNEIISAMPGLLDMAAAEGMDLATGADIMASALRGFGLEASNAGRISNILAQTSAASNSSISGLGESLKYVAPLASGLGISIEETNAMLGKMADAGIKGSQGGTALRAALTRLSKEPKAVAKEFQKLGISARDSQGNLREIPDLMQALNSKIKDKGSADQMQILSDIFGSEAASGMLAIMKSSVDGSLQQLTRLNRESSGQLQALSEHTSVSMDELRAGMEKSDKVARELGISYQDLSVYTAMMANSGIKGAAADNAMYEAFSKISKQPKQVEKAMKSIGVGIKDSEGHMRDFPAIINDLNVAMKDMKPPDQLAKLTEIFGKDGAKAIQLFMQESAKGTYDAYSKVASEAVGVSQEMAEKIRNTLKGQMTIAGSAVEGFMIEIGNVLLPYATKIVEAFSTMVSGVTKLMQSYPGLTKVIVSAVGGFAALKVAMTGARIGGLLLRLPFQGVGVVLNTLSANALTSAEGLATAGKQAGIFTKLSGKLTSGVKSIGGAFKNIATGIGSAFKSIMSMGKNLITGLFSPIGLKIVLIGAAIAALAAGAYLIYKNWDKIKAWWNSWTLKDVFAPVKEYALQAWTYIQGKWQGLKTWWNSWTLADVFAPATQFAANMWSGVIEKWENLKAWWNSWTLKDVFAPVKEYALQVWTYIQGKWQGLKTWWNSWTLSDVFAPVTQFASNMRSGVIEKWESLKACWNSWTLENIFAPVKEYALQAWTYIQGEWQGLKTWWNSWTLSDVFAPVTRFASNMRSGVIENWENLKAWWNLWTLKDVFAPVEEYALRAWPYIQEKWQGLKTWWDSWTLADVFAPVTQFASNMWSGVIEKWESLKAWWNSWTLKDVFSGILPENFALPEISWESVSASFETAKNHIVSGWENVKSVFQIENFSITWDSLVSGWDTAKSIISDGWSSFKGMFDGKFEVAFTGIEEAAGNILSAFSGVGTAIKGLFTFDFSTTWNGLTQAFESTMTTLTPLITGIKDLFAFDFGGMWDGLISGFNEACSFIGNAWDKTTEAISSTWNNAVDWTASLFGFGPSEDEIAANEQAANQAQLKAQLQDMTMLNKMSEGFAQRVAEMSAVYEPFKASLAEGFETIYTTMSAVAENIHGVVIPAITELVTALSRVGTELQAIAQTTNLSVSVNGGTPITASSSAKGGRNKSGSWWAHAEGGIFSQPHFGVVAEDGREAIIPLEDFSRGSALWLQAGQELGLLGNLGSGESERIPLWKAASDDSGLVAPSVITNNNSTNTNTSTSDNHATISPVFQISFNGSAKPEDKESIMQMFRECWNEFQSQEMRLSFA